MPRNVYRAKGLVWLQGFEHPVVFQLAGRRSNPFEMVRLPSGQKPATRLVFIVRPPTLTPLGGGGAPDGGGRCRWAGARRGRGDVQRGDRGRVASVHLVGESRHVKPAVWRRANVRCSVLTDAFPQRNGQQAEGTASKTSTSSRSNCSSVPSDSEPKIRIPLRGCICSLDPWSLHCLPSTSSISAWRLGPGWWRASSSRGLPALPPPGVATADGCGMSCAYCPHGGSGELS